MIDPNGADIAKYFHDISNIASMIRQTKPSVEIISHLCRKPSVLILKPI